MNCQPFVVRSKDSPPSCTITIENGVVVFSGNFYEYISSEFQAVKQGRVVLAAKDFLGLGYLKKRSNKRLVLFLFLTGAFSFLGTVSDKLDYFFFLNTGWLSTLINVMLFLSVLGLGYYLISQKNVVEISFLERRFCVDKKLFLSEDIAALQKKLKSYK